MSNIFKGKHIKIHKYYFFDDTINIKNLAPSKTKIDKRQTKTFLFISLDVLQ